MTFCFRYISVLLTTITLLSLAFTVTPILAQDSDLFSSVNPKSAFSSTAANPNARNLPTRVTSGDELRELLKSAGFEAKTVNGLEASTNKEIDPWTIPVLVTLSEDEQWVQVVLGLTVVKDRVSQLTTENLLDLMKASQDQAPATFDYHHKRQRIEVRQILRNSELTGTLLRNTVNRLAIAARNTSELWASDRQRIPVTAKKLVETGEDSVTKLTGQWVASKSTTEAFALDFQASGAFKLVYVKDGKQTNSSGQYAVSETTLTLNGDTMNLVGTLNVTSATEFQLTLTNQLPLKFVKAR